jgi:hypothetical protein
MFDTYRRVATSALDFFEEFTGLDPFARLPEKKRFLVRRYKALGDVARGERIAKEIKQALFNASPEDKQAVYEYLTTAGANASAVKNTSVRMQAVRAKQLINELGDELVKRGLLAPEARETFRDRYLPRIYFRHLLDEKDYAAFSAGKKPSNLGYLRRRKDIPEDVRRIILGEVTDPGFLATVAIDRTMRDIALLDWLASIAETGDWVLPEAVVDWEGHKVTPYWLKAEAERLRNQARHYTVEADANAARARAEKMEALAREALGNIHGDVLRDYQQIPDQPRYGRLRGLYVRREIYDDIMGVRDALPDSPGWFQNLFGYGGLGTKLTQLWKLTKVPLNPPSQVRNFVSNAVMLQLSGVPLHRIPQRLMQALDAIATNGRHWQIAQRYGVTESTFTAQEVFRVKRDLLDLQKSQGTLGVLGRLHRMGAIVADKASDAYQFMEALFKTAKIIDAMEQGMSEQDAVLEAQKWLFDYSLVPKSVRYARNAPVGVPFLTFYTKTLPRMVEVALLHPQRFLPWAALFYGWQYGLAALLDVDDDDLEALREALPEWLRERGHVLMIPYRDEHGRWQFLDLGYFMPWAMWTELGSEVARGDLLDAAKTMGLFSGPVTEVVVAMKTGKDSFTGRDIVPKDAPPAEQLTALLSYAWSMLAPPFLTENGVVGHAYRAITGQTNRYGDPLATDWQVGLRVLGVNAYAIEPELSRNENLRRMKAEIIDVQQRLVRRLQGEQDPARRDRLIKRYRTEMQRRTDKLKDYEERSRIHPKLATQD